MRKAMTKERDKLTAAFLRDLRVVYAQEGPQCLRTLAAFAPDKFIALVARLVPPAPQSEDVATDNATSYHTALQALTQRRLTHEHLTPDEEHLLS